MAREDYSTDNLLAPMTERKPLNMTKVDAVAQLVCQLKLAGLPLPECEYRFAPKVDGKPMRRWRFDLAWPDRQLAAEIDGSVFTGGRHGGARSAIRDLEKRQAAACLGWRIIPLTPRQATSGEGLTVLEVALGHRSVGDLL